VPTSGAVLYELTENLNLKALSGGQRKATSQLLGTALAGTPLCPTALAHGAPACTIAQFDNPVDGPELVVGRGHFSGKMDFSPAMLNSVPLGSVVGEVGLNGSRSVPFTGVFLLPVGTPAMAFYLGASGSWEPVLANEQALGYPTVKFEISF
jgi:hypothetical protein